MTGDRSVRDFGPLGIRGSDLVFGSRYFDEPFKATFNDGFGDAIVIPLL